MRPHLSEPEAAYFTRQAVLDDAGWDALPQGPAPRIDYRVDRSAADGRSRFASVQAAVLRAHADAQGAAPRPKRLVIGIAPGDYEELVHLPPGTVPLTLVGLGPTPADVRIRFALHAGASGADFRQRVAERLVAGGGASLPEEIAARIARCSARERIGTFCTPVVTIERDGTQLQRLTITNAHAEGAGDGDQQAVALVVQGADRVQLQQVRLLGHQDTLRLENGAAGRRSRTLIDRSLVAGDVDFIFGSGTAFFQRSEIRFNGAERGRDAGFIGAPSTDIATPHGFVFDDCDFSAVPSPRPQRVHLARQWFPGAGCSPYGDAAAACVIARDDAAAGAQQLKPSSLRAVGQMVVLRSRLGPHIAADEAWAPWQRDRTHRAYRPAQFDSDDTWQRLAAAGHDPAAFGFQRPRPPRRYLAEYRNRSCAAASPIGARAPCHGAGME